jgi:NADH-quinone oxidoreductase subunit L
MKTILFLLLFFPLFGAFISAIIGRRLPRRLVETIACTSVVASFLMALVAFLARGHNRYIVTLLQWIDVADFSAGMNVYYDPLAAIMALMVTFVSGLIHLYSVSFMRDDEDYVRFFCYMNLFVFSMLVITLSDNLVFLYLGWEGVGFCSYALIGFWYRDLGNAMAGRKAFYLTRIGDVAFGIAIGLFFIIFEQLSIFFINGHTHSLGTGMATVFGLLLLGAAIGKSAQLPLVVWLPDAMAGPTPVSALIHAATMVTAGVYLLMRMFPVISQSPAALLIIALVGAITALYAACSALAQKDIKRVLAYSTISQVSYMLLGVGAGDITGSMFHLLTHAFFKALLFLAAGCVIQALHEEHDIFQMGNLRRRLPGVYWLFLAGAVSLGALPFTGGFFSKDRVLLVTLSHPELIYKLLWGIGALTALLTPLYTFRLFFITFLERPGQKDREIRPVPKLMVWVLWPLAFLSLFGGFLNLPAIWSGSEWLAQYLASVPGGAPSLTIPAGLEWAMEIGSGLSAIAIVVLAYFLYRLTPFALRPSLQDLFFSGFYLDRLYQKFIVLPYQAAANFLWLKIDEGVLDEGIDQTGYLFPEFSMGLGQWTTGRLSTYLKMILLGFTVILLFLGLGWFYWK